MAKSERHQYNRQLKDYCNDFYDIKTKTTKMHRKIAAKSAKRCFV